MTMTSNDRPFVGHVCGRNEIEVIERSGDLVCKTRGRILLANQVVLFVFGAASTAGLWLSIARPATLTLPWVWRTLLACLALICWPVFFRNLLGRPRFEVSGGRGEILLFRRNTDEPWMRIAAAEISHFTIEKRTYKDESLRAENAVLILFTTSGARRALCASTSQELIRSLAEGVEGLTQR